MYSISQYAFYLHKMPDSIRFAGDFTLKLGESGNLNRLMTYATGIFLNWKISERNGWRCFRGMKGKRETGVFLLASTSFGNVVEINRASPTYLLRSRCCFYFWQQSKCLCFPGPVCLCARFTYTVMCPKRMWCLCVFSCVQTDKALSILDISEI